MKQDEKALLDDDANKIRLLKTGSIILRVIEYVLFFMVLSRLLDICT